VSAGHADFSGDLGSASAAIGQGVPEVAIVRLQSLLTTNLQPDQRRLVSQSLVQALVVANRPSEAIALINQWQLVQSSIEKFWYAQALASTGNWSEALRLYETAASDTS